MRWLALSLVTIGLAAPPAAGAAAQARATTAACPQRLDRPVQVVNIRVSGVSCAGALRVIRALGSVSAATERRLLEQYRRQRFVDFLGYRIRCIRGAGFSFHAWRPGANFYFTVLPEEWPRGPQAKLDDLVRAIPLNARWSAGCA